MGNNMGEIFSYDGVYGLAKTRLSSATNPDTWVRKILECKYGLYVVTQTGSYLFNKEGTRVLRSFVQPYQNRSSKAAVMINDSILCTGTHAVVYKININGFRVIDSINKRVVSISGSRNGNIYVGSSDGLYEWNQNWLYYFGESIKGLSYKINSICSTGDGLMFIGPGTDSLFVLRDRKLLAALPLGDVITGNTCRVLYSRKAGEVWLGTNKGLNRLTYKVANDHFEFHNTSFGTADGLGGEQVNDVFIKNDTVYAATNNGISFFPVNLQLPVTDITTYITKVTINNKDTVIAGTYSLPYDNNNISIEFAAADLTGYYPIFEYSVNEGSWVRVEKNIIELKRLAPGSSNILIRSLKRDGTPSSSSASINIYINTPFWKNGLFWTLLALVVFGSIIYLIQKKNHQKRVSEIQKIETEKKLAELEMQALLAQINPHFVFNCLNSIKGFVYEKDYLQADKYLDKFSDLLRSTMDNAEASVISLEKELQYLDTYLQLEKLRFENKFVYTIRVENEVDQKSVFVPAMLLQPYVENAIRHGVRHLPGDEGRIEIVAKKENRDTLIMIDDNGVGRERARQLKSKNHIEYQSRGMNLSRRRAELYHIGLEVLDKMDEKGMAAGTRVVIRIGG